MKIIDLLNKIANGEEVPKKIRYSIYEYGWQYDSKKDEYCYMRYSISDEENKRIDDDWFLACILNKEVEIIEEEKKIPEKLNLKLDDWTTLTQCDIELSKKIDEIIDYLNSKGDE